MGEKTQRQKGGRRVEMSSILIATAIGLVALLLMTAHDRWLLPWRVRRRVDKLLRTTSTQSPAKRKEADIAIYFDEKGFTVRSKRDASKSTGPVPWSEVVSVSAFKQDWLTIDCICLAVALSDDSTIVLNEDMEGWKAFTASLPSFLRGCRPSNDWFSEVAFPAFATNMTAIYRRDAC
jgi:hypothetical protein